MVLIGAEPERPYERPPLTKDYLRGESEREKAYVHRTGFYAQHEIELETGVTVTGDRPGASRRDARTMAASSATTGCCSTTGAEPRRLHDSRRGPRRRLLPAHARRLRPAAGAARRAAAGWWSSAPAGSAASSPPRRASAGSRSPSIDPRALPNERIFGAEVGAFYRDVHAQHGVELLLGDGVEAFEGDGAVTRGYGPPAAAGSSATSPSSASASCRASELARDAGLEVDNGIVVDEKLQTSAPGIFAAGDVANAWHPFYDQRIRVEHWANALNQGPAAARAMLGERASYDRIPYFFSDQYDVGMEYSGHAPEWDEVVFRGDPASGEFVAFWLRERARRGRHERQRLGRQRARPGADPLAPGRSRRPRWPIPTRRLTSLAGELAAEG